MDKEEAVIFIRVLEQIRMELDKWGYEAAPGKWVQGTKGYKRLSMYAWKTVVQTMHKIVDDLEAEVKGQFKDTEAKKKQKEEQDRIKKIEQELGIT
jgi:hypothetical protein